MLTLQRLAWIVLALSLAVGATTLPAAADPPISVTPGGGDGGTIGIGVIAPGDGSVPPPSDAGGKPPTNPCAVATGSAACIAYEQSNFCSIIAADWAGGLRIGLAGLTPAQVASLDTVLTASGCPRWTAVVPGPTAAQLALTAYGLLRLLTPVPARYPMGTLPDGRPYTVVNTYMWFWSASASWRPLSKRVCAGALCATATATPTTLSFDPGNGDQQVSCAGPGAAWVRPAASSWVPPVQPEGCDYRYRTSTFGRLGGVLTATYTITWHVAWIGSNGTAGVLNPLVTTARSTFAVAELQSVTELQSVVKQ